MYHMYVGAMMARTWCWTPRAGERFMAAGVTLAGPWWVGDHDGWETDKYTMWRKLGYRIHLFNGKGIRGKVL